jgi:hypothetical protein
MNLKCSVPLAEARGEDLDKMGEKKVWRGRPARENEANATIDPSPRAGRPCHLKWLRRSLAALKPPVNRELLG